MIEGHTDNEPIHTSELASNWELASLRATSVVRYLIKYQGVDPKRLVAVSYGEQKPVVANDTQENKSKNRRIEILITTETSESE
jgi:chemotaxis protein MotB